MSAKEQKAFNFLLSRWAKADKEMYASEDDCEKMQAWAVRGVIEDCLDQVFEIKTRDLIGSLVDARKLG